MMLAAMLAWAPQLQAQDPPLPALRLGGVLFDSTTMSPLAGAAVYLRDTDHAAATDGQGRFGMLGVPPGTYELSIMHGRISELGYAVPPSWRIEVGDDEAPTIVRLALPSWATLLETVCGEAEAKATGRAAIGIVEDDNTGMPLPGATVTFNWAGGTAEVTTDGDGRFWACGLPEDLTVFAEAAFYGETTSRSRVAAGERGVAELRFGFSFDIASESLPVEVQGAITDQSSGDAIDGAYVRLEGAQSYSTGSAPDGGYSFSRVEPGPYVLRVEHIGYGTQTHAVVVEGGGMFEMDIGLATDAVELPGIVVTAVSARERERLSRGTLVGFIERDQIEARENEARHVGDLIRGNIHALSVREDPNYGGLCIEARRERAPYPQCNMVMVFIDGMQIYEAGAYVASLPPQQIQDIEFVPSSLAGSRYGTGARYGVLLIRTRRP